MQPSRRTKYCSYARLLRAAAQPRIYAYTALSARRAHPFAPVSHVSLALSLICFPHPKSTEESIDVSSAVGRVHRARAILRVRRNQVRYKNRRERASTGGMSSECGRTLGQVMGCCRARKREERGGRNKKERNWKVVMLRSRGLGWVRVSMC